MATLYRTYRPQRFAEVVGQEHVTGALMQALSKSKTAHAYLFHGPRGTGKTTTARLLAKAVNCQKLDKGEPCNSCTTCRAATNNRSLDIIEIDAASNRGIDDIRALKDGISLAPAQGAYKVYIVDEVHMLTKEAAAALLKTLEEPVSHAIFILATTELHKVPETILSRCQVYRFRRATDDELRGRLQFILKQEKRTADEASLNFIISRSDGCYRDAESLLGQMLVQHAKKITVDKMTELLGLPPQTLIDAFLASLVRGESSGAVNAVDEAFATGFDPEQFLSESIFLARTGALALIKGEKIDLSFTREPAAETRLAAIIRALIQAMQDLAYVPQPLIALHLVILQLCTTKGSTKVSPATRVAVTKTTAPIADVAKPAIQESVVSIAAVTDAWPKLITQVRVTNPVAATFLRAMEPTEAQGSVITIRAAYALHRNFFEKLPNRLPIEQVFSDLLGVKVTVRCYLDEVRGGQINGQRQVQQEGELLATVKEVFGATAEVQ